MLIGAGLGWLFPSFGVSELAVWAVVLLASTGFGFEVTALADRTRASAGLAPVDDDPLAMPGKSHATRPKQESTPRVDAIRCRLIVRPS